MLKMIFLSLRVTKKGIAFIYQKNDFIVIANESSSEAISKFFFGIAFPHSGLANGL